MGNSQPYRPYGAVGRPVPPPYARGAYPRPAYRGGYNPALALDAADGVIDGRYFGAPIAGRAAAPAWGYGAPTYVASPYAASPYAAPFAAAPYAAGPASAALALDAADGVIDGRYFGSPIAGAAAHYAPTYVPHAPFAAAPVGVPALAAHPYGYGYAAPFAAGVAPYGAAPYGYGAPALAAPSAGAAYALDAADGVIDGRYHGAPIGVAAPAQPAVYGQPTLVAGSQAGALALDAADGRIDGKYYGQNIAAAAPQPHYAPAAYASNANAARALDAADGVIDGRYYGNRIVHG